MMKLEEYATGRMSRVFGSSESFGDLTLGHLTDYGHFLRFERPFTSIRCANFRILYKDDAKLLGHVIGNLKLSSAPFSDDDEAGQDNFHFVCYSNFILLHYSLYSVHEYIIV